MNTISAKIIKELKNMKGSTIWIVTKALSEEFHNEQKCYNVKDVENVLRQVMSEYFQCCDKPRAEFLRLMYSYENTIYSDNISIWANFLRSIQVRDHNGNYINGFDFSFSNIE